MLVANLINAVAFFMLSKLTIKKALVRLNILLAPKS